MVCLNIMCFIGKELPNDRCDFDMPIPSTKLQLAVSRAFDTLGQAAKDSLLTHLRSQGIDLDDGSQRTLNQLNAALEPIFSRGHGPYHGSDMELFERLGYPAVKGLDESLQLFLRDHRAACPVVAAAAPAQL